MPDAELVRQRTGFAIGAVPPLGHAERLETFVDEDLLRHDEIWAAASPRAGNRVREGVVREEDVFGDLPTLETERLILRSEWALREVK